MLKHTDRLSNFSIKYVESPYPSNFRPIKVLRYACMYIMNISCFMCMCVYGYTYVYMYIMFTYIATYVHAKLCLCYEYFFSPIHILNLYLL